MTIENFPDDMKMFQAVKFLNLRKPTKILAEVKDVRNYFKQKFCPKDFAAQQILLSPTPSFQKYITNQKVVDSIKKLKNKVSR